MGTELPRNFGLPRSVDAESGSNAASLSFQAALATDNLSGAREKLTAALQLDPDNVEAHNVLGFALGQQDDLTGALDHLHRAIQLDPKFAEAHYNLGPRSGIAAKDRRP
jgi:Flp pilus assembly protein TadD